MQHPQFGSNQLLPGSYCLRFVYFFLLDSAIYRFFEEHGGYKIRNQSYVELEDGRCRLLDDIFRRHLYSSCVDKVWFNQA